MEFLKKTKILNVLKNNLTKIQLLITVLLIAERVISSKPKSIASLHRNLKRNPLYFYLNIQKIPQLKYWYNTLIKLENKREKMLIELYNQKNCYENIFLYDITSSYFEGTTCPISDYGHNRDGKKGKMQIVIGLICNSKGEPIWIDTFKGNTSDQTTVKEQIETLRNKLKIKNLIFIGDRGMVTTANLKKFEKEEWWENFKYITAVKRTEMLKYIEEEKHPLQMDLFSDKKLVEIEYEGIRYILCHNPFRKKEDENTREKLLQKTIDKLEMIKKNVQKGHWKLTEVISKRVYTWLNRWNMGKFIKDIKIEKGIFEYKIDEEKLEEYKNIDGCFVIKSNIKKPDIKKDELLKKYKDLKYVENAFRTMKSTDIQIRPIRHFNEKNVRGHVFLCFLSYKIIWEIKQNFEKTLKNKEKKDGINIEAYEDIWEYLKEISAGLFKINGMLETKISSVSKGSKLILKNLNIKLKDIKANYII